MEKRSWIHWMSVKRRIRSPAKQMLKDKGFKAKMNRVRKKMLNKKNSN